MDLTGALNAVTATNAKAQQDYAEYQKSSEDAQAQSQETLNNAKTQTQNLLDATQASGEIKQSDAQNVVNSEARNAIIQNYLRGSQALAPDVSKVLNQVQAEADTFAANPKGNFIQQLATGMTGRNFAAEHLNRSAQGLKTLTDIISDLSQKASAEDMVTKQLQATASAPQQVAVQSKIDQADAYLQKGVPALTETNRDVKSSSAAVAEAGAGAATESKNMFSALIQFRNANTAEKNQVIQNQLLQLNLQEKTRDVANAMEDDNYLTSLSSQLNLPKPALKAQGPAMIAALSSIAAGIPVVSNIADPKEVELAARASVALPDPFQKVTAPYIGNELLAFQQDQARLANIQSTLGGKEIPQNAKNARYSSVRDVQQDFLDKVPVKIPGESQEAPLVNIIGNWFLNPVGSKGDVFWQSPQVKAYIASGSPGASVAQRIFNDKAANPGALKSGIDINYLQAVGATPAAAFDFYKFVQHQVILSTPYSVYGLAPPKANIPLGNTYINLGAFNTATPRTDLVIPKTEADIEAAFIKNKAATKAAAAAAKLNLPSERVPIPGGVYGN